jgi:EAL domain-containing protein (putative c-di-GMP-specific phosphodiesterase class I)
VADDDLETATAGGSDIARALAEGAVSIRFDTAADPAGRPALVHAVPVWQHASLGAVRGSELWTAAAQQGHTAVLQEWLLNAACAAVARLDVAVDVAVSLPPGQVSPDGLAAMVTGALESAALPGSRLVLSFTEETLTTSSAALVPELESVREHGVRLCMDNYGMGQSLFALMARISLDAVRADLAALSVRDDTGRALRILDAIVQITSGFGLTVIAGGISTDELRDEVAAAGVHLLHGRALPHDLDATALSAVLAGPVATRS